MPNLPRRMSGVLNDVTGRDTLGRAPVPLRVERAVTHALAVEHGKGIVQAARVRAVEYVATEALHATAALTELEALYIRRSPLGEARYRAIADTAAVIVANIVAEAGR